MMMMNVGELSHASRCGWPRAGLRIKMKASVSVHQGN